MISKNPLDKTSDWYCPQCENIMSAEKLEAYNQMLIKEINSIDKRSPTGFEEFIEKYKTDLHSTNTHILQVKYALIQLYGNVTGYALSGVLLYNMFSYI